jgi:helicase
MAWEMIERRGDDDGDAASVEFVSAKEYSQTMDLTATSLGHRVSELYLDPYTANNLVERLREASEDTTPFAFLHMICHTLEMRPLIRVKKGDKRAVESTLLEREDELLVDAPDQFDDDYEEFLNGVKTTLVLYDWINEVSEKELNDKWDVTPGHLQAKRSLADWLLYSCDEILDVISSGDINDAIRRLRQRVNLGVRESLLGLTRFDGVGRVRSRRLFNAGIENAGDVKAASYEKLQDLLGPKTAKDLKNQVGQEVTTETVKRETHGNLLDYRED